MNSPVSLPDEYELPNLLLTMIGPDTPESERRILSAAAAALSLHNEPVEGDDAAKVDLGPFLVAEGVGGQMLNRQAAKVYQAAVNAISSMRRG
jgi:hypothetical protein